ncbi:MAG: glycosyltransferase family 4 protein [Chloroflexota bacterium]
MHIAYFTNTYLPVISGVVRCVNAFRKTLSDLGHNVFVFAQQDDSYADDEPFVFRYPSLPLPVSYDVSTAIPFSPFIDRLFPALKVDIVHAHHPILLGQAAASKAQDFDLPLVFTFHTQYEAYTHYVPLSQPAVQDFLKGAISNWLQEFMSRCQHIVIPSESIRSLLVQEYGLVGPYTVIPTGIELSRFEGGENGNQVRQVYGWRDDDVLMVSVGRLAKEKNWELLLQVVALMTDMPHLHLALIGDGPECHNLQRLAAELGIAGQVSFVGEVPFDEVPAFLKAADFFAFASVTETQGLVTVEAMAAGLPVVAIDASGTRDIVQDGVQGFLVADDPQAFAQGIRRLLADAARFAEFSQAAKARAGQFEMKALAKSLLGVYRRAIEDKKEGRTVEVQREAM